MTDPQPLAREALSVACLADPGDDVAALLANVIDDACTVEYGGLALVAELAHLGAVAVMRAARDADVTVSQELQDLYRTVDVVRARHAQPPPAP